MTTNTDVPNSCLVKIQQLQYRALLDSGAAISLISEKAFKNLKFPVPLGRTKVHLQAVNGGSLKALGSADLEMKIAGLRLKHTFIVVSEMNRHVILGSDFLDQYGVTLYFGLRKMKLKNVYVPLERDIHIASITRLSKTTILKPKTVNLVQVRVKRRQYFEPSQLFQVEKLEKGRFAEEPELVLEPSIAKLSDKYTLPVLITNTSNKTVKIKKGNVLGTIKEVKVVNTVDQDKVKRTPVSDKEFVENIRVDPQHKEKTAKMLLKNKELFAFSDLDLGHTDIVEAEIITDDARPINLRPYRTPLLLREVVSKAMDDMLAANIIKPSSSPWNAPLVVVDKPLDHPNAIPQKRICVDFRELNKVVKPQSFPIPLIDDILGNLRGCTYFSTLDLRQGFHQIKLSEESSPKTAFSCFKGKYQYNVLPFGLCNSPAIFQQMANKLLLGLEDISIAYIDDILIYSRSTAEDHLEKVQLVLDRIRKHNLKLKLSKCHFLKKETKYLGFVINEQGIKPNMDKVAAIRALKTPNSKKDCRSILGMAGWYRRHIPNFSKIVEPIVELTKKYSKFKWTDKQQKAFDYLKDSLTAIPLLAYPDPNKPYILYTDASDTCIGACLVQECDEKEEWIPGIKNEKPIYFLSHKLTDTQIRYPVIQKECYAIVYALHKLDYYLHNAKFEIRTDHLPLKSLLQSQNQNKTIQQWALTIGSYNCNIEYVKGVDNCCADLLSRSPPEEEEDSLEAPHISDRALNVASINTNQMDVQEYLDQEVNVEEEKQEKITLEGFNLAEEQPKDQELLKIKEKLEQGTADKTTYAKFTTIEDVLYYISQVDEEPNLRVYIPSHLQQQVIAEYHELGHFGVDKVFQAIKEKYYWPNLYKQIQKYTDQCVTCKVRNMTANKAPLCETSIPLQPMATVQLDLSGPYPQTLSGNKYIASFVCVYSGWIEAWPLPDKSADSVVNVLIERFIPRHSTPMKIITDNGTEFVNRAFEETLRRLNIKHVKTSFYHPQGNAKVERSHRTLHDRLSKMMEGQLDSWDVVLNQALCALRCQPSKTTRASPFSILYGRQPTLPIDNILKPRRKYMGEDFFEMALENQHKMFMQVYKNSRKAKKEQAEYTDKKNNCKEVNFKVGDHVYYKNHSKSNKLESNWKTHYIIVKQTSPVSFVIRNQLTAKTAKAHANSLRMANIEWKVPKSEGKGIRKSALVETDESTTPGSSEEEEEASEDSSGNEFKSEPITAKARMIKEQKQVRENPSSSDDEPPLFERQKREGARQKQAKEEEFHSAVSTNEDGRDDVQVSSDSDTIGYEVEEPNIQDVVMDETDEMSVNASWQVPTEILRPKKLRDVKRVNPKERRCSRNNKNKNDTNKVKTLLNVLASMM